MRIALSQYVGRIEELLFYFAAIAGGGVFGSAVEGWAILKAVSRYALWQGDRRKNVRLEESSHPTADFDAAIAHNRFQIFVVGTGMSLAAGGIAGATYHCVLHLLS
jgi:hypothetical protein